MTPLLFISVVTLILLALVYWILSSHEKRLSGQDHHPDSGSLSFETAQELLKHADQDQISKEDVLRLKAWDQDIMVYWQVSPDTWEETLGKYGLKDNYDRIIIRLYDPYLRIRDIEVHHLTGGQRIKTGEFHVNYAVLGINRKEDFIPLFLSRTVE